MTKKGNTQNQTKQQAECQSVRGSSTSPGAEPDQNKMPPHSPPNPYMATISLVVMLCTLLVKSRDVFWSSENYIKPPDLSTYHLATKNHPVFFDDSPASVGVIDKQSFPFSASYRDQFHHSWTTARPGVFFSLSSPIAAVGGKAGKSKSINNVDNNNGSINGLTFGLAWSGHNDKGEFVFRHAVGNDEERDGVVYKWFMHDGATRGSQLITDNLLDIEIELKFQSSRNGFIFDLKYTRITSTKVSTKIRNLGKDKMWKDDDHGIDAAKKTSAIDFFFYLVDISESDEEPTTTIVPYDPKDKITKMDDLTSSIKLNEKKWFERVVFRNQNCVGIFQILNQDESASNQEGGNTRSCGMKMKPKSGKKSKIPFFKTKELFQECGDGFLRTTIKDKKKNLDKDFDFVKGDFAAIRKSISKKQAFGGFRGRLLTKIDKEKDAKKKERDLKDGSIDPLVSEDWLYETKIETDWEKEFSERWMLEWKQEIDEKFGTNYYNNQYNKYNQSLEEPTHHTNPLYVGIASLLGGIGRFRGKLLLKDEISKIIPGSLAAQSQQKSQAQIAKKEGNHSKQVKKFYSKETYDLTTGTPSRSKFPRGFLWDEGFHALVYVRWNTELFMDIVLDWFSLQGISGGSDSSGDSGSMMSKKSNSKGYIPREIPLGLESESFVPEQFLGQNVDVMNPPTLLFGIRYLIQHIATSDSGDTISKSQARLHHFLLVTIPRVARWMEHWHLSQENRFRWKDYGESDSRWSWKVVELEKENVRNLGEDLLDLQHDVVDSVTNYNSGLPYDPSRTMGITSWTCYRWQDRDQNHVLSSGLDDYPRGLFVDSQRECHLDNHVWFMYLVSSLEQMCSKLDFFVNVDKKIAEKKISLLQKDSKHVIKNYCKRLNLRLILKLLHLSLQRNHFDAASNYYADYSGLQPVAKKKTAKTIKMVLQDSSSGETKKQNVIVAPPWDGNGQCNNRDPDKQCEVGSCCSSSGWCGYAPPFCDCEGCKKFFTPLEARDEYENQVETFSPHFGYVNMLAFALLGLDGFTNTGNSAPITSSNDGTVTSSVVSILKKMLAENISPYGIMSLSKKDPLFGKGENYWRGKIWANLNFLIILKIEEVLKDVDEGNSDMGKQLENLEKKELKQLKDLRSNFLKNIETQFKKDGNFWENYEGKSGKGAGILPFTGWTAAVYVLLKLGEAEKRETGGDKIADPGGDKKSGVAFDFSYLSIDIPKISASSGKSGKSAEDGAGEDTSTLGVKLKGIQSAEL